MTLPRMLRRLLAIALACHAALAAAQGPMNTIDRVDHADLLGGRMAVRVVLAQPLARPPSELRILHPAPRLVLEFSDTRVNAAQRAIQIDSGVLRGVRLAQQGARTRLVIELLRPVVHETLIEGNSLTVLFDRRRSGAAAQQIQEVAFTRGPLGEGRVSVRLSTPRADISLREQGRQLAVDFPAAVVAPGSLLRLDVLDFATPVAAVATHALATGARILITPRGPYAYEAREQEGELVIVLMPAPAGAP